MRNSYSCYEVICNQVFHNISLLHVTSRDILREAALTCGHSFCHHKKCYNESLDIILLYHLISVRSLEKISRLKSYVFLISLVIGRLCSMDWQLCLTICSFLPGTVFAACFWFPLAFGISKILTDLELEMYKEASHTMPYPTSRSPGKRVLVFTGETSTSVVSGKTHSTVTSLRTGAMAFFRDLTICWAESEYWLGRCVSREGVSRCTKPRWGWPCGDVSREEVTRGLGVACLPVNMPLLRLLQGQSWSKFLLLSSLSLSFNK